MTGSVRKAGALAFIFLGTIASYAGATRPAALTVVAADRSRVVLELAAQDVAVEAAGHAFVIEGTERTAAAGEPDLPCREVLVGLPQQGGVRLVVAVAGTEQVSGAVVGPVPSFDERGQELSPVFGQDRLWPAAAAELVAIEAIRGVRAARVRLSPVQYNPVRQQGLVHHRLTVTLTFEQPAVDNPTPDPLDSITGRLLVNGAQAMAWKPLSVPQDTLNFFARSAQWCRIKTDTGGVYRITAQDLRAAGSDPGAIVPATLRLYSLGPHEPNGPYPDTMVEVPLYVSGEDDGAFSGGDYAAFYADAPSHYDDSLSQWQTNPYTNQSCYWLTWGGEPGRRMATASGAGAASPRRLALNRVRLESDSLCPARSGLLWLWDNYFKIAAPYSDTFYRSLALPGRDTIREVRGRLYGRSTTRSAPDYLVAMYLNGILLDTLVLSPAASGPPPADFAFDSLPVAAASRGAALDSLWFELVTDQQEDVFLDYLEVDYVEQLAVSESRPSVEFHVRENGLVDFAVAGASGGALILDITDPWQPRRITEVTASGSELQFRHAASGLARFVCVLEDRLRRPAAVERRNPGGLRGPAEDADYYVVAPDEFAAAARLYARFRDGNVPGVPGARARAVRLGDINDDYGFGWTEPGALKKFLGYKRPAYALLAGDATYDYRNNLHLTDQTPGVPACEVGYDIDPEVYGLIAKGLDAWYADFEGTGTSPDMILGRVTVRSEVELRRFQDKVRRYETQPLGLWARRLLLLGDDEFTGDPSDRQKWESFTHIVDGCEVIGEMADTVFEPVKVYLTEYPLAGINDKPGARAELKRRLDAGALLWFYFGHGAGFRLAHEQALNIEAVPDIRNGTRIPFAFYGSCGVGRFEDTRYPAIAEELVRKEDGCIATIGATKATTSPSNYSFARDLFRNVVGHPEEPMGAAFFGPWRAVNNLHHFFGDPAARLRLSASGSRPLVMPETLYPGGMNAVEESAAAGAGWYDMAAWESDQDRSYQSVVGTTSYRLPGGLIWTGNGTIGSGPVRTSLVVPVIPYPDTTVVPNGRYARVPNSSRVSALVWADSTGYSATNCRIPLVGDTVVGSGDIQAPKLTLWADNVQLQRGETTAVPKRFTLTGRVSDPSGIMLVPLPGYRLGFYIGDPTTDSSLIDHFEYDPNSVVAGRFRRPAEIRKEEDSIVVTVADNRLNLLRAGYYVRTDLGEQLRFDSALVFPNPGAGRVMFTFRLSRAALVSVKVYTIAGRLIRHLQPQMCQFGYNQLEWDGLDTRGLVPANGVYLYKLDAVATEAMGIGARASFRDKLLIHR